MRGRKKAKARAKAKEKKFILVGNSAEREKIDWFVLNLAMSSLLILWICSAGRHFFLRSSTFDLAIFDQALWLISQRLPPFSTLIHRHILGDHGAWILYPLGLLYAIKPSVQWLFFIQAVSLSSGAVISALIARQRGLDKAQSRAIALAYLFHPIIFCNNFFDFHPEVVAVPLLLVAVYAAREGWTLLFAFAIVSICGCKEVLSLTVAFLGLWLLLCEKEKRLGAIALGFGASYFVFATTWLIPAFSGGAMSAGFERFAYLGKSMPEIIRNIFLAPSLLIENAHWKESGKYVVSLFLPVLWAVRRRALAPLIGIVPSLLLNIFSNVPAQRHAIYQYSLPILPFLILMVLEAVGKKCAWFSKPKFIIGWSVLIFCSVVVRGFIKHYGTYPHSWYPNARTWQAEREAIALVPEKGKVLATFNAVPQLSHRKVIRMFTKETPPMDAREFDTILINAEEPGWVVEKVYGVEFVGKVKKEKEFSCVYEKDGVYMFRREDLR